MKKYNVVYVDKFGLEWSGTAVGLSQSAAIAAFRYEHPGCHNVRIYEG